MYKRQEIYGGNYTVEADDMMVYYSAGSGISMWRNGSDTRILSVRIYSVDQDRWLGIEEAKGMVWVTKNHTDFVNLTTLSNAPKTDSNGYINYTFGPGCKYDVGVQYWKINLEDNVDFKDTNISGIRNITLMSYLNGTIHQPNYEVYKEASGNNVTFNMSAEDECGSVDNPNTLTLIIDEPGTPPPKQKNIDDIEQLGNGFYFYNWSTTSIDCLLYTSDAADE